MTAGATPQTAEQVNFSIGQHLQQFVSIKESIEHDAANLAGIDLTQPPYSMAPDDQTTIKTALNQLNGDLQAVDMTFINRLTGLF
jgi:hypothetical protein